MAYVGSVPSDRGGGYPELATAAYIVGIANVGICLVGGF